MLDKTFPSLSFVHALDPSPGTDCPAYYLIVDALGLVSCTLTPMFRIVETVKDSATGIDKIIIAGFFIHYCMTFLIDQLERSLLPVTHPSEDEELSISVTILRQPDINMPPGTVKVMPPIDVSGFPIILEPVSIEAVVPLLSDELDFVFKSIRIAL